MLGDGPAFPAETSACRCLRGIARLCIKLSKERLSRRHSRISEPREDSLDGEQLRSLGHFHRLALSPSQSLCVYHSAAVAFRLLSIRSITVLLQVPQKLLIQFGACHTYATKTALLYLHLAAFTWAQSSLLIRGPGTRNKTQNGPPS